MKDDDQDKDVDGKKKEKKDDVKNNKIEEKKKEKVKRKYKKIKLTIPICINSKKIILYLFLRIKTINYNLLDYRKMWYQKQKARSV